MINPENDFKFETTGRQAKWIVPGNFSYFAGHFPDNPVLPAFGMIDATLELLRQNDGKTRKLVALKSAKFLQPVTPGLEIEIGLTQGESTPSNESWRAIWKTNGQTVADLVLSVRA